MNRKKLIARLRNRDFRRAFAEEAVDVGIPIQVREMRLTRGWSQTRLGKEAGMAQEQVSLAEKMSHGRFNVTTLKKLAAAFDCGLMIRFVSFGELLAWKERIDAVDVTPPPFDTDSALSEVSVSESPAAAAAEIHENVATAEVIDLLTFLRKGPRKPAQRAFKWPGGQGTNPRPQFAKPGETNA